MITTTMIMATTTTRITTTITERIGFDEQGRPSGRPFCFAPQVAERARVEGAEMETPMRSRDRRCVLSASNYCLDATVPLIFPVAGSK